MNAEIDLNKNGILMLDNLPEGTEVGIDYHSWYIGPRFQGISNIPPGFHFVFFSSVDKHGQQSPRTGFFQFFKDGDVIIKVFNAEIEDVIDDNQSEESRQKHMEDLSENVRFMAPYPTKECMKWSSLTGMVSENLVQRIQPKCGKINFLTEVSLKTAGKRTKHILDLDSRIEHKEDPDALIRFSEIPSVLPNDLTPEERTKHSMDSSYLFEQMIEHIENGADDLLGELQIAFISFLIGQVYDCFDHWKLLVSLITNCEDALSTKTDFFCQFLDLMLIQIKEIPEDFFVDIVAQNNFLFKIFQQFFANLSSPSGLGGLLLKKASILKHELSSKFDFDFDEENEEDLPVVVEL